MFRVVCIDDTQQTHELPTVEKGKLYTVVKVLDLPARTTKHGRCDAGDWYVLAETGLGIALSQTPSFA